ncbi:MAG: formylglycine-generating enzyme family protein [Verrucomicrobia bacterium]|nr:formylglycine-generating enzyme family protein [Verrucomicrobiota bacterium]MBU4248416.1 formylglycine-generating enzyme family protein [Verrucomicrobiota bacterium]MBU4290904.1 formylglycine-generating enzyme family protein [Verrucomicrobiota bacterium]MBU4497989.1 formylglycine-generating enzyme family protein [Verrucomicrobiota bacterium]MCG2679082.1 formylglycine-generating enzyme family protein [Kiritimatiellia bacterium]
MMKKIISHWVVVGMAIASLSLVAGPAIANNVVVTNTALEAPGAGKVTVQFDLSWDNSWRDGVNYDACWVFVKYSTDGGTNWSHATLGASGTNPVGFTSGSGTNLDIIVPADKNGAFIQRSVAGAGTVANTGVRLMWDFATNGVSRSQSAQVKVFAVEMVYVAQGSFYLGSGGGEYGHFYQYTDGIQTTQPYQVSSESAILVGATNGNLYSNPFTVQASNNDRQGPIPAAFPKGFAAFYLMKTEISQRQYCDFLNTLTAVQQINRHDINLNFNTNRNFIKKTSNSPAFFGCDANNNAGPATAVTNVVLLNETNDAEWVACNWISWMDGAAYMDWAALRPFTELEFEKACRGTLAAVSNEYAWGDTTLEPATTSLTNQNTASEAPNRGNCLYNGCAPAGPYRCGSYAQASSSRANAGAGYYGVLDLSGNLWERPVTAGLPTGRSFTGVHGDGVLSINGHANTETWPGLVSGEVTTYVGSGGRGGRSDVGSDPARVSDRNDWSNFGQVRRGTFGGRGARSVP